MLIGALLRLILLRHSPPGLNQDEAANAWNAWCLLKTGKDQHGVSWPIFYSRFFGGYSSMLYVYWMIPFEAIGGLNVWTVRLPSAVGGILTIPLIYYIGARMWSRPTGLLAAGLLALTPWHIQQSRWGHEASIVPLLICATVAVMLWAGLPLINHQSAKPRPLRALLAGAIAGISCYGYPSIRILIPLFICGVVAVTWRGWWKMLKQGGHERWALILFAISGTATFGPLVYKHLTDTEHISRRLAGTHVWDEGDSIWTKGAKMLARYPAHFGPVFLFVEGELESKYESPPSGGMFGWDVALLMLTGVVAVISQLRSSWSARVLAVWLLVYPIGDCISLNLGPHALRSLPGLPGLVLLAAVGGVAVWKWLQARNLLAALAVACVFSLAVTVSTTHFVYQFFVDFPRRQVIYHQFHGDLMEACEWVKPRFKDYDAIFWTVSGINMPYMMTLVGMEYDPHQWLSDRKNMISDGVWDYCLRYGKMHFLYAPPSQVDIKELRAQNPHARVLCVIRPENKPPGMLVHKVVRPDGTTVLWFCEVPLPTGP